MGRRHVKLIVSGRVQGVSYRAATAHEAQRLGVRGWVRNLPDGSVELEALGETDRIAALVAWCHDGPPAARVTTVDVTELEVTALDEGAELDDGFAIRR